MKVAKKNNFTSQIEMKCSPITLLNELNCSGLVHLKMNKNMNKVHFAINWLINKIEKINNGTEQLLGLKLKNLIIDPKDINGTTIAIDYVHKLAHARSFRYVIKTYQETVIIFKFCFYEANNICYNRLVLW